MKYNFSPLLTSDKEIREVLKSNISKTRHDKIIEELGIDHGSIRADVAVIVGGYMHGYEIKSDKDDLTRLKNQAEAYNRIFDKITLVVGKKHIINAIDVIPIWWGIQLVTKAQNDKLQIYNIRQPEKNQEQDSISLARLLWRQEALNILEEYKQDKGVRSKPREDIYKKMSIVLDTQDIENKVSATLRNRVNWRPDAQLV